MRTAPSILKEPAPYKSALLAATISMVKRRIATQSLLFCFDEFEDFGPGIFGIFETTILKHFEFESADEGFGPGVLAGVGSG